MVKTKPAMVKLEAVQPLIHSLRGEQVMLDRDLAELYGVETRALNQAVSRNRDRFPTDFMFTLNREEIERISQTVTSLLGLKFSKRVHAFTEQGVAMLSSVLRSRRAVLVNVEIMRAFVTLRREAGRFESLRKQLAELERSQKLQGEDIQLIFAALRQLEDSTSWAYPEGRRLIGFRQGHEAKGKTSK
jgi:hypothetical protein